MSNSSPDSGQGLETMFRTAYWAYARHQYPQAIELLTEIENLAPGYSQDGIYARELLAASYRQQQTLQRDNWWRRTGILVILGTILGLSALVFVIFLVAQSYWKQAATTDTAVSRATALVKPLTGQAATAIPTPLPTSLKEAPSTPSPAASPPGANTPPACTEAGLTWTRPIDAMEMACVPAGIFTMGLACTFKGCENEVPAHQLNLDAFWIDTTEVTNAMFSEFIAQRALITAAEKAGASEVLGNLVAVHGADWRHPQGPLSSLEGIANHPVVQMDWFSASGYCEWAGGRLPSEAQWEKAARGTTGQLFPWGDKMPNGRLLNFADLTLGPPHSTSNEVDGFRYTAPVGSYPAGASPYGVFDLAGNVWEWTRSLLEPYPYLPTDGREPAAPGSSGKMVLRGGSWYDDAGSVRSSLRYGANPQQAQDATGFRCVLP